MDNVMRINKKTILQKLSKNGNLLRYFNGADRETVIAVVKNFISNKTKYNGDDANVIIKNKCISTSVWDFKLGHHFNCYDVSVTPLRGDDGYRLSLHYESAYHNKLSKTQMTTFFP